MTSLGDDVDGFVGDLVHMLLDPTPGDVVNKYGASTCDYTETHRLRGERQRSINYHFIDQRLFLVEGYMHTEVRGRLRDGRAGIDDPVCEGRKLVRDGYHGITNRMIRDRVFDSIFY